MFAQESVMEIQNIVTEQDTETLDAEIAAMTAAFTEEHYLNNDEAEHLEMIAAKSMVLGELYERAKWQAKAQAVPEGFVEKTESNTHHYFKLKDWDEWTCIDGIKDAITSDHDINAIVEVECLEVIEINNKPCFALLAFGKRHGTEVKFFDTEEEAIEAQEPTND